MANETKIVESRKTTPRTGEKEKDDSYLTPTTENATDDSFGHLTLIVSILEQSLTPKEIVIIKSIGKNIVETGLSIEDSALLVRLLPEQLEEIKKKCPEVETYFKLKTLEYKHQLLKIIHSQAKITQDIKVAKELLETKFSDEFDPQIRKEKFKAELARPADDILREAFDFIRERNSQETPVNKNQNNTQKTEKKSYFESIKNILS